MLEVSKNHVDVALGDVISGLAVGLDEIRGLL